MNLPELSIRRPVMTTLVMSGILGFGILAYSSLPVSHLPNVDFPTISVSAGVPGASPETMASSVATPLEKQFSTIAGLDSMTSTSSLGSTSVTLQFSLERDLDAAAQDVQSAISAAQSLLPREMPNPPSYRKVNPADQPVLYLAVVSSSLPLSQVDEYAETIMAQRISTIAGVAQVQVYGSQKFAVRVQVDPLALASRGIGLNEISDALAAANVNKPTGAIHGARQSYTIQATGQLESADEFRRVIVAFRDGAPVRVDDLARVVDSVENDRTASWYRDERAIVLAIQRQPGTNTVAVVDSIRELLPQFNANLPAGARLEVLFDRSESIRESVRDVKFTLILAICLVVLVIFLFLRTLSATLIPSVAMPLSVVGTFMVMYLMDFSVDNFSLMALTLSVGFVVDDAIVVLENIVRHVERGEPVYAAALRGSREIAFTVISMTLSLAAVFLPVLFMGGILGRLLHEFAVTIGAAILVSGFVSLTLTPMLCSRFLRPHGSRKHGRLFRAFESFFDGMRDLYERTLVVGMRWHLAVTFVALLLVAGTAYLFVVLPKGFVPTEDTGSIFAFTEASQDISYDAMVAHQQEVAALLLEEPEIHSFMSSVGTSRTASTANTGRIFLHLVPREERASAEEIVARLRPKLAQVPGIKVYPQILPLIRIGGQLTKSQYQFTLYGTDLAELYDAAPAFEEKLHEIPGLIDVTSDLQIATPQLLVSIDRDRATAAGLDANQIESALNNAYGGSQVSTIYTSTNQYAVILEVLPESARTPDALSEIYLRGSGGQLVPLDGIATVERSVGPLTVAHLGQLPAVTLSFNLSPGASLGDAVGRIRALADRELPATVSAGFQGAAEAFQSSLGGLGLLLVMAVLVIYLVLGILYESFVHPLTILSGLPSAGFGALATLWLFGQELNIYGFVGVLMLIGIVKKNAIMMIDFALAAQRSEGQTPADAIRQACVIRFRPIMMTTMAALMGTLPIALGFGAGADARRPLGLAVVGGLVVSQLMTLYLTPVIYLYLEALQRRMTRVSPLRSVSPYTPRG